MGKDGIFGRSRAAAAARAGRWAGEPLQLKSRRPASRGRSWDRGAAQSHTYMYIRPGPSGGGTPRYHRWHAVQKPHGPPSARHLTFSSSGVRALPHGGAAGAAAAGGTAPPPPAALRTAAVPAAAARSRKAARLCSVLAGSWVLTRVVRWNGRGLPPLLLQLLLPLVLAPPLPSAQRVRDADALQAAHLRRRHAARAWPVLPLLHASARGTLYSGTRCRACKSRAPRGSVRKRARGFQGAATPHAARCRPPPAQNCEPRLTCRAQRAS